MGFLSLLTFDPTAHNHGQTNWRCRQECNILLYEKLKNFKNQRIANQF
jgi:hypothetical protein